MVFFFNFYYKDTTGFAFIYPIVYGIYKAKIMAYVHYPTISRDMLSKINNRIEDYNNSSWISKSFVFSQIKLLYGSHSHA